METLLFLCHRIPFPPNKGDKITTYNLVKYLSKRYTLYIGCFIDDEHDWQYISDVQNVCEELFTLDICRKSYLAAGVKSLLVNEPVSTYFYADKSMQNWVDTVIAKHGIDRLMAYSGGTAQFINHARYKNKHRILDMADVDSDKWRQYKEKKPIYSSWIYAREQQLVEKLEQEVLDNFQAVTLITDEERDLFRQISPAQSRDKIVTLGNGVDTNYFDPAATFDFTDKPDPKHDMICFTGAMDYWANVDAVVWFVEKVWPNIRQHHPNLYFYIVGGKPSEQVIRLGNSEGVVVTGRVVDVRPFVEQAKICVAPLRIARGVQNKVLEAMSMAKPVVMTTMGMEGIALPNCQKACVIDDPDKQAIFINQLLEKQDTLDTIGMENRQWIQAKYGWDGALSLLDKLLEQEAPYDR